MAALTPSHTRDAETGVGPFPPALLLTPTSRWPTTLPDATVRAVLDAPLARTVPAFVPAPSLPRASIVIVTLDGLVFTRLCLESLVAVVSPAFEIVVVDNGSTDGTAEYLDELSRRDGRVRVERNSQNLGFGAATNRGAETARGDVLILLNNDTIAPRGSLERLTEHLSDSRIGLVGAVTNRAGNEAQIEVPYRTCGELAQFATEHMAAHRGELFDIRTVTMFCAALPRRVWNDVGPLDERFEIGLFEDDDYAMRIRQAGYRVVCAEDVFVHHFGQASIGRLAPTGEYGPLFHTNRARWEAKWGVAWQPYTRRERPAYNDLVARIRKAVCEATPAGATVAVISKGDAELLRLGERRAWHFLQHEDGTYAGHHPADSAECIAELERLRAKGADFLVVPSTASWWLDHYEAFARYLADRCRVVLKTSDCAVVATCRASLPVREVTTVIANERPTLEQVFEDLKRAALQPDLKDRVATFTAEILQTYIDSGEYRKYFHLWESCGVHVTPVHFYFPIPDTRELSSSLWEKPSAVPGLDLNERAQLELLSTFSRFRPEYDSIPMHEQEDPGEFYFGNPNFSGTDALILYCMIRHFQPASVVEVGCGFSSRMIRRAVRKNRRGRVTCIDPFADGGLLEWFPEATVRKEPVQEVELSVFEALGPGDILFIDSSHVARIGGDVTYLFLEVIPRLQPGVIVHVHDIFLPMEIRKEWVLDEMRFWTEQYLLQAFLAFNRQFEVLMANCYLELRQPGALRAAFPHSPWWGGGSFWMRRLD